MWNNKTWGKTWTEVVPAVAKLKWLEPRHMINIENRWARDRTEDFHYMWFNGIGYVAWENVWGVWNGLTPRAGETLRRLATVLRRFPDHFVAMDWEPYAHALQQGVFASRFATRDSTLWTIVNRNEYGVDGEQLAVAHHEGAKYHDLWNGVKLVPRIEDGPAFIDVPLEAKGFGAVIAARKKVALPKLGGKPLHSFSNEWQALAQKMVEIKPTRPAAKAPAGMVTIPAGEITFQVRGVAIEGFTWKGLDFPYPWGGSPRRPPPRRLRVGAFPLHPFPLTPRRVCRRAPARRGAARGRPLPAANLALVLPTGLSARPARQVPADGAREGPLRGDRLSLRRRCTVGSGRRSPSAPCLAAHRRSPATRRARSSSSAARRAKAPRATSIPPRSVCSRRCSNRRRTC